MVKYEIKQEFIGTINDVEINDKQIYYTTRYILEQIEQRFGEVYNNKFIKDLAETIRKTKDNTDSFSYSDLENDFYYLITNKDYKNFEELKFTNYYYAEYLNERLEKGEYTKTINHCMYCSERIWGNDEYYCIDNEEVSMVINGQKDNKYCSNVCVMNALGVETRIDE